MRHYTMEEQTIIKQALTVLDSKLKTKNVYFDNVVSVKNYLRLKLESCEREYVTAFYLDTKLRLIEYKMLYAGILNSCPISPRELVKEALYLNAAAIILAHNHPSGDSKPSQEDIRATLNIRNSLDLFDINLIDHFVVGHNEISSLSELNLI